MSQSILEESIMVAIKQMLGVMDNYDPFDQEILILINSSIFKLSQLGVGASEGFVVHGVEETWGDLLGDRADELQAVKEYIYLDVKLSWDPPTQSGVMNAWAEKLKELTWRILHQVECGSATS